MPKVTCRTHEDLERDPSGIFGKQHLDHLVAEFVDYYNHQRNHMERDHLPPIRELPEEVEKLSLNQVEVKSYVRGPVKSFERKAA